MAAKRPWWANWKAQDKDGIRYYYEYKPKPYIEYGRWISGSRLKPYMKSAPNENWLGTLKRI